MNYNLDQVIIEVTRWCNIQCAHCLRGDRQKGRVRNEYIHELMTLASGGHISSITFTGGEPTLNPEAFEYTMDCLRMLNISFGHFYIATNGMCMTSRMVRVLDRLYEWAEDSDTCSLELSNDIYHIREGSKEYFPDKWEELPYLGKRFKHSSESCRVNLIDQGRAYINQMGTRSVTEEPLEFEWGDNWVSGMIYMNIKGDILFGCDYSYEEQEKRKRCHVSKLAGYLARLEL